MKLRSSYLVCSYLRPYPFSQHTHTRHVNENWFRAQKSLYCLAANSSKNKRETAKGSAWRIYINHRTAMVKCNIWIFSPDPMLSHVILVHRINGKSVNWSNIDLFKFTTFGASHTLRMCYACETFRRRQSFSIVRWWYTMIARNAVMLKNDFLVRGYKLIRRNSSSTVLCACILTQTHDG